MALFKFLKTPNPSQYDYKPRFWDPEKERIERRLAELKANKNKTSAEDVKGRLSGSFRNGRTNGADAKLIRTAENRRSNFSLIIIICVLVVVAYVLLNVNLQGIMEFVK